MTMPTAPQRTPAGEDELRHRTRKLGQRYRTMLLLIDGKRPLDELLSLAQQAGAAGSHFEELVQLGLVELPEAATEVEEGAVSAPTPIADMPPVAAPAATIQAEPPEESPPPVSESASEPVAAPPQTAAREAPPAPVETAPAVEETPEQRLLQQVRDLLIDTLRIDSPLFGARTFFRVRSAQSTNELIELVWEIEDHLTHARHSRGELISLQRARELLGMGNTRFAGETNPGMLPK
jgi:hypothetical protein